MECRIIRIDDQTWRLEEEGVRFFLLTGSRSALLIDSGMQVHNAKKLAEGLTALPLSLLNTHADRDHIGSNAEFDAVYMSPAELVNYPLAKKASDIIPIRDGSSIDLGGRRLEIIEIPGHTPGSIAVLDVERRVLFSGDTVQDGSIFLFGPMRNIPAFYHSLKRLEGMTGRFDLIYPSHGSFPVKKELISRLISQTAKLERGELAASEAAFMGIPLKRYEADAAVFLCGADYGEKAEMSVQGGQRPSGNSGADDKAKSGKGTEGEAG